jgi:type IV secretory pathway VirB2 component (pilin)
MREFTVAIWVRFASITNGDRIFVLYSSGTNNLIIQVTSGGVQFQYTGDGTTISRTTSALSTGIWYHLALTVSLSSNQAKAYLNGSQIGTTSTVPTWSGTIASSTSVIGASTNTGANSNHGYHHHAILFNSAISGAAIADLADQSGSAPTSTPTHTPTLTAVPCSPVPTATTFIDVSGIEDVIGIAQSAATPLTVPVQQPYDLYGNALNFFTLVRSIQDVNIGSFTALIAIVMFGFFLHFGLWLLERALPLVAIIIGVVRKIYHIIMDFFPGT